MEYMKLIEQIIKTPLNGKRGEVETLKFTLDNPNITLEQYQSKASGIALKSGTIICNFKLDKLAIDNVIAKLSKEGLLGNVSDTLQGIIRMPYAGRGIQSLAIGILVNDPSISLEGFTALLKAQCLEKGMGTPADSTFPTYYRDLLFRIQQALSRYAQVPLPIIALPSGIDNMVAAIPASSPVGKGKGKGKK
jgi:hypothetical protein